ncbi:unnamed protein product, partial [Mesorhabditis spiculigera]
MRIRLNVLLSQRQFFCNSSPQLHSGTMASSSTTNLSPQEEAKRLAAYSAGEKYLISGARIGVGSGSTVKYLVDYMRDAFKNGNLMDIKCVPTSSMTKRWLVDAGLPVTELGIVSHLDICIDGADEVDDEYTLIKGGGGCLFQEKVVQKSSSRFIIIADSSKQSKKLGEHYAKVPIDVIPFGHETLLQNLSSKLGGKFSVRSGSGKMGPVITDNGCYIVDWEFPKDKLINWPEAHATLKGFTGVVETGLFFNCVESVIFAYPDGSIKEFGPKIV